MIYKGKLRWMNGTSFIETGKGERLLEECRIWDGYIHHWENQRVCARKLPQQDYETRESIIIMWPDEPPSEIPFVEIYYNERLVKYPASTFGHNAINVNGEFFNFSHLINENEVMDEAEYMYRPALGEFAPSPTTGKFEILENGTAYYDKFGRNFMRGIHVIRLEGIDADRLSGIYHDELNIIHATPSNPDHPEKYRDFSFYKRSCTTLIRDGLQKYGFQKINGFLPRDFFISAAMSLMKAQKKMGFTVQLYNRPQLKVPEAPYSRNSLPMNPMNWTRLKKLKGMI
ncbi:MAG: hypothetical protein ISR82_07560 [Candidatus Marinimicrobia bacterium]|nr:hypothetical protein [Candidatus Neomarinimicrobiota bacterium]MBL7011063.1 hypothetical protein [Candidatus Neomarinimicrobiota bacterium]MBL7030780.1 hypothetical protein [Candidatus Neomarinimicrobiota bacterium]